MRYLFFINPTAGKRKLQKSVIANINSYFSNTDLEYKIHITATIGVLTCNTPCEVKELIKEVDDLLYEGKTSGRNVVICK